MKRSAIYLLLVLLAACAQPLGRADLLNFIKDGKTTREQAYLNLGEPSAFFEGGRIVCFRLGRDEGGDFIVAKKAGFAGVTTSLIMVFDEGDILSKHSLVQVKGP
ncbi:hypothetical protein [Malonomonas rubra]|uniref:hypothetical protein n=1 Tax=Malonomonas rubra TaxID=57040 RepID=UPI0026E9FBD7|nr:hypothetical protein [Malonomonas rubra]